MGLLDEILSKSNLTRAYDQVVRNHGSAGTDRMQVSELKRYLQMRWGEIRSEIELGNYQPQPVLEIEIPKRSGGKRLLGIPTVTDRKIKDRMVLKLIRKYLQAGIQ
jgi:RNA-directed DNA polymerase